MNTFKLSSKTIHKDDRSSIENKHNETIEKYLNYYSKLPCKKKELEEIKKIHEFLSREEQRCNNEKIKDLELEIKNMESQTELNEYLLNSSKFINDLDSDNYRENSSTSETTGILNFINVKGTYTNGERYLEYLNHCFPNESHLILKKENSNSCPVCNNNNRLYDQASGDLICEDCGFSEYYIQNDIPEWNDNQTHDIVQPFAYKRINHFKEWLSQIQAKETTNIPNSVIDLLLIELKKERITDSSLITCERIKKHLKKLKLNKYYEHIPNIIHIITKNDPLKINLEFEKNLLEMFDKIQEPFSKHCPKTRKNFLSYSYTLYKFCQLLKKEEYLIYFPLLKSREKLFEQESIWRKICSDLNWEFIPCI